MIWKLGLGSQISIPLRVKYHQLLPNAIAEKTLNSVCVAEKDAASEPDPSALIILSPCASHGIVSA